MTPKEKAKELYEKFFYSIPSMSDEGQLEDKISKECALIAIDEIKEELYNWIGGDNHSWQLSRMEYFEIVKKEINKL